MTTNLMYRGAAAAMLACFLMATLQTPTSKAASAPRPHEVTAVARQLAPWRVDPFPSTYQPLPRTDFLLVGATILDGAGHRLDDADVLVHEGKIARIGHALPRDGVRVIEARGRWVTPGIIDVHTHNGTYVVPLTDIDKDSSDVSELNDPDVADTWIETAINTQDTGFSRALEGGVTTMQVLPGSSPIFGGRSVIVHPIPAVNVAAMKVPAAPQGFKMACGENPKSQDADTPQAHGPTSRQGEIAFIRESFMAAQDYRAAWDRYVAGKAARPKRDLKLEALAGILAGDIHVAMHCYRSDDMATMLEVAHEFGFTIGSFHHAVEAYKIPALLRQAGTCAAVWGDWWGFKMEGLDGVRANAALLDRAGVCVAMHSDSAITGQRLNIEAAKAGGAARALGMDIPPERMIRWVTSNAARILGMGDRIGTLAPGYDADLVVWSADPFSVYARADLVVIDGAVAFDRAVSQAHSPSDFELGRIGAPRS